MTHTETQHSTLRNHLHRALCGLCSQHLSSRACVHGFQVVECLLRRCYHTPNLRWQPRALENNFPPLKYCARRLKHQESSRARKQFTLLTRRFTLNQDILELHDWKLQYLQRKGQKMQTSKDRKVGSLKIANCPLKSGCRRMFVKWWECRLDHHPKCAPKVRGIQAHNLKRTQADG